MTPTPEEVQYVSNGILLILFGLAAMFAMSASGRW